MDAVLLQEPERRSGTPKPVTLESARDYTLAAKALELRADKLGKMSKSMLDEGYARESRVLMGDAASIRNHILPRFAEQQELPLVKVEAVRAGIAEALRQHVHRALAGLVAKGASSEESAESGLRFRENEALDRIATQVEHFATVLAEDAFNAGYAARLTEPLGLVQTSLDALRASVV